MNSAPSIKYSTASDIITSIRDSALWMGSRARIKNSAPATDTKAKMKNRMKGRLIRVSPARERQSRAQFQPDLRAKPAAAASTRTTSADRSENGAEFREPKRRRKSSRPLSTETRMVPEPPASPREAGKVRRERARPQ